MTRDMPSVSVIIPTYNRARYVGQAIASVLAQTYTDFELIVVDDGSTDATSEVLNQFSDARLVYIQQENQNAAGARNTGFRAARSAVVCFLDSDDLFLPMMLTESVQFLTEHPDIDLIIPGRHVIDTLGCIRQTLCPWEWSFDLNLHDLLAKGCPTGASAIMVRRPWLDRIGGFEREIAPNEDWDLLLRLAQAGCKMAWLKKILLYYRLHDSNLVHNVKLMRDQHLNTLNRVFARDDLPADIRNLKQHVRARLLIDAAMNAYYTNDLHLAKTDLRQAIRLQPTFLSRNGALLAGKVRGHIEYWAISEPIKFIEIIRQNLPEEALIASRALVMLALRYKALRQPTDTP